MPAQSFKYLRSDFTEPKFIGEYNGLGQPFLTFDREYKRSGAEARITIHVDLTVEGFGTNFRFNVKSKTLFKVILADDIVVSDMYNMNVKAIEDLRAYLDKMIPQNGVSAIGVPMPPFEQIHDDLHNFVTRLHATV